MASPTYRSAALRDHLERLVIGDILGPAGGVEEIIDVRSIRQEEGWENADRVEDVMEQESFVHLRTRIWRHLRANQGIGPSSSGLPH